MTPLLVLWSFITFAQIVFTVFSDSGAPFGSLRRICVCSGRSPAEIPVTCVFFGLAAQVRASAAGNFSSARERLSLRGNAGADGERRGRHGRFCRPVLKIPFHPILTSAGVAA